MEIRFAKPEDTLGILRLLAQIGKVHYDLRPDMFQAHAQKFGASQVLARLENPNTPTFVAAEGDKVLGYSFCEVKAFDKHPVMADHKELFLQYSSSRRPAGQDDCLKRFLAYFIYRHCTEAFDKEDFCIRLTFCLFCERLFASLLCVKGAKTLQEAATLASILSEEIEYSDDNTWALMG